MFSAVAYFREAQRWSELILGAEESSRWSTVLASGVPSSVLEGAGVGLTATIDRTLRILGVGGELLYEELVLVMTNAIGVEFVAEVLREHRMIDASMESRVGALKDALRELAVDASAAYKSAHAQITRTHKLRSEFLLLGNAQN